MSLIAVIKKRETLSVPSSHTVLEIHNPTKRSECNKIVTGCVYFLTCLHLRNDTQTSVDPYNCAEREIYIFWKPDMLEVLVYCYQISC